MSCVRCGMPVTKPATGRPPSYCSVACRRAAAYEVTRCNRKIERLQDELDRLPPRQDGSMGTRPFNGRTLAEHRAHLTELIEKAEARMVQLLDEPE